MNILDEIAERENRFADVIAKLATGGGVFQEGSNRECTLE